MKVLYITGSCLTRNTSANMSHNAFVQGLLENNCDLDIVMARESWGEPDQSLPIWEKANYYSYVSVSFSDKLRYKLRGKSRETAPMLSGSAVKQEGALQRNSLKYKVRAVVKRAFYLVFPRDPLYPLEKEWLKNAACFHASSPYDLVISNSSPAASHKLAEDLLNAGAISAKRWIQIWEDPWYHDLYGGHSAAEEQEEHRLLQAASEIVYVSPLTLMYQQRFFPDCADKMQCVPLPALKISDLYNGVHEGESYSFGYFGDYYSETRDIKPFYEALTKSGFCGYIYGDSDLQLASTEQIQVSERVTLDILSEVQEKTDCLVHLSNLQGGQIPGKIYHYSATNKPILFILDGTDEEITALKEFFGPFERYYFCNNSSEEIMEKLKLVSTNHEIWHPVEAFSPRRIVKSLIG